MKIKVTPVKQKGSVVGQVTIEVLETLEELVTEAGKDLLYVLGCYNRGNAVALQAQLREGTPGPGGPRKNSEAYLLTALGLMTADEFKQFAGQDPLKIKAWIKSDPGIAARVAAKQAADAPSNA